MLFRAQLHGVIECYRWVSTCFNHFQPFITWLCCKKKEEPWVYDKWGYNNLLRWGYHNFPAIRQWGYHNFADFVNQKKVMISPSDPPHVSSVQKPLWLIFVVREFYYLYYGDWNHPLWFNPFEPARIKSHDGSVCMLYMVTLIISIPQSC